MKKEWFLTVLLIVFTIGGLKAQERMCSSVPLTVATYNLRYNNPEDGENAWPKRKGEVKALIRFHDFDLFGTEEGLIEMLKDISEMNEYSWFGRGRDDGKEGGEHSAVFYRKDRFKLLEHGDFWLSETPDKPTFGWDATCKRICTWGKFEDKVSNKEFYFFCAHFDWEGEKAKKASGELMVKKIKEIAGEYPVICVGDFNSPPETEQIRAMKSLLEDSREVSEEAPYGPEGTFEGFDYEAQLKGKLERDDYIFVSKKIKVLKYGVLTDSYDCKFPSDHLPVVAKVVIN